MQIYHANISIDLYSRYIHAADCPLIDQLLHFQLLNVHLRKYTSFLFLIHFSSELCLLQTHRNKKRRLDCRLARVRRMFSPSLFPLVLSWVAWCPGRLLKPLSDRADIGRWVYLQALLKIFRFKIPSAVCRFQKTFKHFIYVFPVAFFFYANTRNNN